MGSSASKEDDQGQVDEGVLAWIISCGGSGREGAKDGSKKVSESATPTLQNATWTKDGALRMPTPRAPATPGALLQQRGRVARKRLRKYKHDFVEVFPYLIMSDSSVAQDRQALEDLGVTQVVNTASSTIPVPFAKDGINYLACNLEDRSPEQIGHWFLKAFQVIDAAKAGAGRALLHHEDSLNVPGAIAVAYIMFHDNQEMHAAIGRVKKLRDDVSINPGFLCQLIEHGKRMHEPPPPPRMYLVGPHSERDPQLVCRLCLKPPHRAAMLPSLDTLDARGCFLVHLESCLIIWVGKECSDVARKVEEARGGAERLQLYERAPTLVYTLAQPGMSKEAAAELPEHTESDLSSPGYQKFIACLTSPTSDHDQWLSVSRAQPLEEAFAIEASNRGTKGDPQFGDGGGSGGSGEGDSPKPELYEYRSDNWDNMGVFEEDDLSTSGMFLLHVPDTSPRKAYLWIGSKYAEEHNAATDAARETASALLNLPVGTVTVEKEGEESDEFWDCFERGF